MFGQVGIKDLNGGLKSSEELSLSESCVIRVLLSCPAPTNKVEFYHLIEEKVLMHCLFSATCQIPD